MIAQINNTRIQKISIDIYLLFENYFLDFFIKNILTFLSHFVKKIHMKVGEKSKYFLFLKIYFLIKIN